MRTNNATRRTRDRTWLLPRGLYDQLAVWLREDARAAGYASIPTALVRDPERYIADHRDKLCFVVSRIIRHQAIRRNRDLLAWVPFESQRLRRLLHERHASWLLDFLARHEVVICNGHYLPQRDDPAGLGACKGYRLGEAWRGVPLEDALILSESMQRQLDRLAAERAAKRSREGTFLVDNLHALELVDARQAQQDADERLMAAHGGKSVVQAYAWHNKMSETDAVLLAHTKPKYTDADKRRCRKVRERRWAYLQLKKFHGYRVAEALFNQRLDDGVAATAALVNGLYTVDQHRSESVCIADYASGRYFDKDDDFGRLHTNVTNTPKHLRSQLRDWRFPAYGLYNIDIKNSQPYFLGLCAKEAEGDDPDAPSAAEYLQHCAEGTMYERLMTTSHFRGTRDEFKIKFFALVLYGENRFESALKEAFQALYPAVAAFIYEKKSGNFNDLARAMQRKESDLVLRFVAPRLHAAGYTLVTIHDSFLCTLRSEFEARRVEAIVRAAFEEAAGIPPSLTIEALRPTMLDAMATTFEESAPPAPEWPLAVPVAATSEAVVPQAAVTTELAAQVVRVEAQSPPTIFANPPAEWRSVIPGSFHEMEGF